MEVTPNRTSEQVDVTATDVADFFRSWCERRQRMGRDESYPCGLTASSPAVAEMKPVDFVCQKSPMCVGQEYFYTKTPQTLARYAWLRAQQP